VPAPHRAPEEPAIAVAAEPPRPAAEEKLPHDEARGEGRLEAKDKPAEDERGTLVQVEGGFNTISLTGAAKVTVTQTGKEGVWVKGDKNAVAAALARVEKDTLYLIAAGGDLGLGGGFAGVPGLAGIGGFPGLPGGGNMKLPAVAAAQALVEFVVEVKDLRGLILNGVGNLDVKKLETKQLTVAVCGVGDLSVAGKANVLKVSVLGNGNFLGEDLKSDRAAVQHTGNGKAVVNASEQLEVTILGTGSVEYLGSPRLRKSILGTGTIVKKR
jgi:hypothetical protein